MARIDFGGLLHYNPMPTIYGIVYNIVEEKNKLLTINQIQLLLLMLYYYYYYRFVLMRFFFPLVL